MGLFIRSSHVESTENSEMLFITKYLFEMKDSDGEIMELVLDDGVFFDNWRIQSPPTKLLVESGGCERRRTKQTISCVRV